jgi:HK97 gp10 family phage protein
MPIEGDARAIAKTLRAGRAGVPRDLERAGVKVVGRVRTLLSTPGAGRLYTTRFKTNRKTGGIFPTEDRPPHVASAPGQPPAPDTGRLRASYGASVSRVLSGAVLAVQTGVEYAPYLEFGTSKIEPRPHLRPAMTKGADDVRQEVAQGIEGRERAKARQLGGKG